MWCIIRFVGKDLALGKSPLAMRIFYVLDVASKHVGVARAR